MTDHHDSAGSAANLSEYEDRLYSFSRQGPQRKSAAPDDPLQDTLEILYSEHRYISSLLDKLEQQATRLKPGKIPDYQLLLTIVDYLTHYPDQYHHPREDLLFTQLLESDAGFKSKLERLEREHLTLHHFTHELFKELTRIVDGRPADNPDLSRRIERYIKGYRGHMDYENREVFPLVSGSLSKADLKALNTKTLYINDPLFGGEVQYQYQRLARSLQSRVEVASQQLIAREMSGIETLIEKLSSLANGFEQAKSTASTRARENWNEQLDAVKAHGKFNAGPNIVFLPGALLKNHLRHLSDGFADIRDALAKDDPKQQPKRSR